MRRSGSSQPLRIVAALYVDVASGPYARLPGVDPWGQARDATTYEGPHPVVAHPYCGPWGRLAHLTTKQDPSHGPRAVEQVLQWGGVLEHPANSRLWKKMGLPAPHKTVPRTAPRVWSLEVEQCRWGHEAEKRTWLLFVGIRPQDLLPIPPWREPTAVIDTTSKHKGKGLGKATGKAHLTHVPKSRRHLTPLAFAEWLVAAARASRPSPGGRGVRRTTPREQTEAKLRGLEAAASRLRDLATPEFFDSSCAHNSVTLYRAARLAGLTGVQVAAGTADPPRWTGQPGVEHVWLLVDGRVFDPTWYVHGCARGAKYSGSAITTAADWASLAYFGVEAEDEEEVPDNRVTALAALLRSSGGARGGRGARFQQVQLASCTDVSKSQAVRALDVVVLGPGTIAVGVAAKELPALARGALVAYGVATMGYNARNLLATRRANRGRVGGGRAAAVPPKLQGCWVVGADADAFDELEVYELFRQGGVNVASYEEPLFACVNRRGETLGAAVGGLTGHAEETEFRFSVAVAERARRRGVASHLVGAVIDHWGAEQASWREAHGVEGVELVAWVINPHMAALLESTGFDPDGVAWSEDNPMMRFTGS